MMDLDTIHAMSVKAAAKAAREGKTPYVPFNSDEIDRYPTFPFPMLGDYVPDGWEKTDQEWFCDMSGFGGDDEPALSVDQFKAALKEYVDEHPGHGFAITEHGQFQCYVAAYEQQSRGNWRIGLKESA